MKRFLGAVFLALTLVLATAWPVLALSFPNPQGYVSDFAGLLLPDTRATLEADLAQLEKDTAAQVAVVTVFDLGGTTIEDYASQLFEAWDIGKKDQDNGVLFIVALVERKARIEVGYGLEAIITDGRAGRILDDKVIPEFKNGDYSTGILQGATAIEDYIRGGTTPGPLEDNPMRTLLGDNTTLMVWLGIITIYLLGFMARSKSIWLGGIWGVIVGIILGVTLGSVVAIIILPIVSGALGALLDFILSRNYKARASSGKPTSWFASGGGFSGGGHSSSGFGGFGGGMSGGGGASRGW
jgi:uncharacterized protein